MKDGKCQNGVEDFNNGIEDNLPYFHTRFCALYRKIHTMSGGDK